MPRFTRIPESTFQELQINAGVIAKRFNPATGILAEDALVTATTGGIKVDVNSQYSDMGSDVDNAPKNSKELKHKDSVEVKFSCTALCINKDMLKMALGAADEREADGAIVTRTDLKQTDFQNLWFIGDLSNGGYIAIKFIDALSTDGFSLQTSDKGKGKISLGFTAHTSLTAQTVEPVEFYLGEAEDESPYINLNKKSLSMVVGGDTETITALTYPSDATVTWASTDTSVATVSGGIVTAQGEGTCAITASITDAVSGITYMDTAIVTVTAEEGEG